MTRKIGAVNINPVQDLPGVPHVWFSLSLTGITKCIYAGPSQSLACNDHYHTGPSFHITSVSSICGHHLFLLFFFLYVSPWNSGLQFHKSRDEPGPTAVKVLSFSHGPSGKSHHSFCLIYTSFQVHGLSAENNVFLSTVCSKWAWGILFGFTPQLLILPAEYTSLFFISVS